MAIRFKYDATGVVIPRDKNQQKFGEQLVLSQQKYANDTRQNIYDQQKQSMQNQFQWNLQGKQNDAQADLQEARGKQAIGELNARQTFGTQNLAEQRAYNERMAAERLKKQQAEALDAQERASDLAGIKSGAFPGKAGTDLQATYDLEISTNRKLASGEYDAATAEEIHRKNRAAREEIKKGRVSVPSMTEKYNEGVKYKDPSGLLHDRSEFPEGMPDGYESFNLNDGSAKSKTKVPASYEELVRMDPSKAKKEIDARMEQLKILAEDKGNPYTDDNKLRADAYADVKNGYDHLLGQIAAEKNQSQSAAQGQALPVGQAPTAVPGQPTTPPSPAAPDPTGMPTIPLPNPKAIEDALGLPGDPANPMQVTQGQPAQDGQQVAPPAADQSLTPGIVFSKDAQGNIMDARSINWSDQPVGTRMRKEDGKMYLKTAKFKWEPWVEGQPVTPAAKQAAVQQEAPQTPLQQTPTADQVASNAAEVAAYGRKPGEESVAEWNNIGAEAAGRLAEVQKAKEEQAYQEAYGKPAEPANVPTGPTQTEQTVPPESSGYVGESVSSLQKQKADLEKYMGLNETILAGLANKDAVTETAENAAVAVGNQILDPIKLAADAVSGGGRKYAQDREKERMDARPKKPTSVAETRTQIQKQQVEARKKIAALDEQIKTASAQGGNEQAAAYSEPPTPDRQARLDELLPKAGTGTPAANTPNKPLGEKATVTPEELTAKPDFVTLASKATDDADKFIINRLQGIYDKQPADVQQAINAMLHPGSDRKLVGQAFEFLKSKGIDISKFKTSKMPNPMSGGGR